MEIRRITAGCFQANCYFVKSAGGRGVVIDPGDDGPGLRRELRDFLGGLPGAILLTHGHLDHVGGARELALALSVPVYMSHEDLPLLQDLAGQFRAFGLPPKTAPANVKPLNEGTVLAFGDLSVTCLHTPGHSPGSCCFLASDGQEQVLLTGDTIFAGGVGRTDLWGGDDRQLETSLGRILGLQAELILLPGHGRETSVEKEAKLLADYLPRA